MMDMQQSSSLNRRERNIRIRRLDPRARTSSAPIVYRHSLGAHRSTSALRTLEQASRFAAFKPSPTSAAAPALVKRSSGLSLTDRGSPRTAISASTPSRRGPGADGRDFSTVALDSSAYNKRRLAREPQLYGPEIAARLNRICEINGINAAAEVMVIVAYDHAGGLVDPSAPPHYTVFFLDANLRVLVWRNQKREVVTKVHLELNPKSLDTFTPINSFAMVDDKREWLWRVGECQILSMHQGGSESERSEKLAMILQEAARELRENEGQF